MNIIELFEKLAMGLHLNAIEMEQIMQSCLQGKLSDTRLAVFLALMRAKGETVEELIAAVNVLYRHAHIVDLGANLIDIVGTGGDGKNTFNISTTTSIVAAAAGARVAKHGSRSVSSKSGSSDVLAEAGFILELDDQQLKDCLLQNNLCFLFAPHFHKALLNAKTARQELGIRSLFNLLGPLINPAQVKKQIVGVFDERWQMPLAQVLASMGSERAFVISSRDGMDEISISDTTDVVEYHQGEYTNWSIDPRDYGCYHPDYDSIIVNSPRESLEIMLYVLEGHVGPARDIVLLNTALALYCADLVRDLDTGILLAKSTIDEGKAKRLFEQLRQFTQTAGGQS